MHIRKLIAVALTLVATVALGQAQKKGVINSSPGIPGATLIQIIRAEDGRRWENLKSLLSHEDARVRKRAALAAGRIGDADAVPVLAEMLLTDKDADVRQMAAFALGEIEAPGGAYALVTVLKDPNRPGRARAIEALGKIVAAMAPSAPATPNQATTEETPPERIDILKEEILNALRLEDSRHERPDLQVVRLGLTAVLRARPEGAGKLILNFLDYRDPSIVATALNTMARLRLKDGNERVRQLLNHDDPIVRANAARVIGAAEHKEAFEDVLAKALKDSDLRVRVSAIRALGGLKDERAADPLLDRGIALLAKDAATRKTGRPSEINEILEIATVLGTMLKNQKSPKAIAWLRDVAKAVNQTSPQIDIALARIWPQDLMMHEPFLRRPSKTDSRQVLALKQMSQAQGLVELANAKTGLPTLDGSLKEHVELLTRNALSCGPWAAAPRVRPVPGAGRVLTFTCPRLQPVVVSDFLRAYAAVKPADLSGVLQERLKSDDVVIRATAAELLGEQPAKESNSRALIDALPRALRDKDLNDAALAILNALAKQKSVAANDAIKSALASDDYQVRRRAVALLKTNGVGDFSNRIGNVATTNTDTDYLRAINRIGKKVTATVVTSKGSFTIEFLPEDAPLTVDNFVQLARKGYFQGQTIPRVVPNFVIQAGDPRGDQNGGPGYRIRCEINEVSYERASLGMALSGKDTGGSQWFVTHSPQQHLDGGYTVFGRVIRGMEVVDSIARGDTIRRVVVNER